MRGDREISVNKLVGWPLTHKPDMHSYHSLRESSPIEETQCRGEARIIWVKQHGYHW